jgi:hypothetical protein
MSAHRAPMQPLLPHIWCWWGLPLLASALLLAVATGLLADRLPTPVADPRVLKEVTKQAVEQPLHFLMAAAPIYVSRTLTGVPLYGWAITPWLAYREWSQWPSRRWWDPPLDWAFMALGAVVATWRRRQTPQSSPRPPSHPLRRKYSSRPTATASISASANG